MTRGRQPKWPDTSPIVGEDGWTEHFGCYTRTIAKLFPLSVAPSTDRAKPGYHVRICGVSLTNLSPDVADGKRRALKYLRRELALASTEMGPE